MQINSGGSQDINVLQSDSVTFRNEDKAVSEGIAFTGGLQLEGAASNRAYIQLINPAGSGVIVAVDEVRVSTEASTLIYFAYHGTQLGTVLGFWKNNNQSKSAGVGGRIAYAHDPGVIGTIIDQFYMGTLDRDTTPLEYPLFLNEGEGIMFGANSLDTSFSVTFRGREL